MFWEKVIEFLWGFIPQRDDDEDAMLKWRWKSVAMTLVAIGTGAYAAGIIPGWQPKYAVAAVESSRDDHLQNQLDTINRRQDAQAALLNGVIEQLKEARIERINTDLIDARRYQCRAMNSQNDPALPFWDTRVQSLKLDFLNLTGHSWPNMDCKSF